MKVRLAPLRPDASRLLTRYAFKGTVTYPAEFLKTRAQFGAVKGEKARLPVLERWLEAGADQDASRRRA